MSRSVFRYFVMSSFKRPRRAIIAWILYDFANSPFSTIIVTFIYAVYFAEIIVGEGERGTALWAHAIAASSVMVAVLAPLLGAAADRGQLRARFLQLSTLFCAATTSALYWVGEGQIALALTLFIIANTAFELGMVFYNAFLPDVCSESHIGRVSGIGWGLGYVGGLLALILAKFVLIRDDPWFGLATDNHQNVRATALVTGAWFVLFSIPAFLWLSDRRTPSQGRSQGEPAQPLAAFARLAQTFREVRRYRQIVLFLLARLLFNDGLITVFTVGGLYATTTFGFSRNELLTFGIVLNVTAGAGAFVFGLLDDKVGGKRTVLVSLVGLIASAGLAVLAPDRNLFWIAAIGIGIFAGPNQSASRSLMGRFVPPTKKTEFFGFFAFSGKATAFLGPLFLGLLTTLFNQRAGVSVVLVLFVAGLICLLFVDEAEGLRQGQGDAGESHRHR